MRGKCVLNIRAPCEPPKISRCGGPVGAARLKNSGRTGTPVTSALRNHLAAAGKLMAAACTRLPTSRLARPGMALGSYAMVGILRRSAANIAGPGGIATHAQHCWLELADQFFAVADAPRQLEQGTNPRDERDALRAGLHRCI